MGGWMSVLNWWKVHHKREKTWQASKILLEFLKLESNLLTSYIIGHTFITYFEKGKHFKVFGERKLTGQLRMSSFLKAWGWRQASLGIQVDTLDWTQLKHMIFGTKPEFLAFPYCNINVLKLHSVQIFKSKSVCYHINSCVKMAPGLYRTRATSNVNTLFRALMPPGKVLASSEGYCQGTENGSGLLSNTHVVHVFLNFFFSFLF